MKPNNEYHRVADISHGHQGADRLEVHATCEDLLTNEIEESCLQFSSLVEKC